MKVISTGSKYLLISSFSPLHFTLNVCSLLEISIAIKQQHNQAEPVELLYAPYVPNTEQLDTQLLQHHIIDSRKLTMFIYTDRNMHNSFFYSFNIYHARIPKDNEVCWGKFLEQQS